MRFLKRSRDGCVYYYSEEEKIVLTTEQSVPPVAGTQSDHQYLKKYDEVVPSSSKRVKEAAKQFMKQPEEKQKEFQYAKALQKDKMEGCQYLFASTS